MMATTLLEDPGSLSITRAEEPRLLTLESEDLEVIHLKDKTAVSLKRCS